MQAPQAAPVAQVAVDPAGIAANEALRAEVTAGAVGNVGSTTSAFGKATGALSGFGNALNANPGLTKVGLGMLSAYGEAKSAKSLREDQLRQMERERDRLNASISMQRQNF